MIIQRMNNMLLKHGKVTFAIFTGVVIVSFVWFFTPGVDGSLLLGGYGGSGSKYGSVLGHNVTVADASDVHQSFCIYRAALLRASPRRVQGPDEKDLFSYTMQLKVADILNIQASDEEVREFLHILPAFQKDGKFSNELYNKYRDIYLAPAGLGFSDLENALRDIIRLEKVQRPMFMAANVVMSDDEVNISIEDMLQKITYNLITFEPEAFADQVKIEDSDLKDFYTANPKLFMSEPESDGLLVFIAYPEKKIEVSEERLKEHYELNKDLYVKDDGTAQPFEEVKDAIRKELETTYDRSVAVAQINAFKKALDTAKKEDKDAFLADPQKLFREEAEKAGLKVVEVKNITARTEENVELHITRDLVEAVIKLHNVGSNTNSLQGETGVSLFMMTARRPSTVQPFEDVKEIARQHVIKQKELELADAAAAQLGLKFMELKDAPAEIEALVKSLNGTWHAEVTRSRFEIEFSPIKTCANEILTTDAGKLSAPNKNDFISPVFVFVSAHTPATAEEIEEQKVLLTEEVKSIKKEIVASGFQNWIGGTVLTYRSGQTQE